MEYMGNFIKTIVITLVFIFILFILLREFNCWYWKINKRISLMEENNRLLKSLLSNNDNNTEHEVEIKKTESEKELKDLKLYDTNQGEIFIKQNNENIEIGNFVFDYYKRPYHNNKLTIKNGPKIKIENGKITEMG